MTEIVKKRLVDLPMNVVKNFETFTDIDQRNSYIKALSSAGWTLTSIGKATGVSRERVRQIIGEKSTDDYAGGFEIPEPPKHAVKTKREFVEPTEASLARLLELQPLAQQVRSNVSRYRAEAEEYSKLLAYEHTERGVPVYRLAKRLGVTHAAIRFRLARYGYKPSANGKSRVYRPIEEKNRAK